MSFNWVLRDYRLKTAREEHQCDKCSKLIAKGEEYLSCFERGFYGKLHQKCYDKDTEKVPCLLKYKKAYHVLMEYWDCLPDGEKPQVDKSLRSLGL